MVIYIIWLIVILFIFTHNIFLLILILLPVLIYMVIYSLPQSDKEIDSKLLDYAILIGVIGSLITLSSEWINKVRIKDFVRGILISLILFVFSLLIPLNSTFKNFLTAIQILGGTTIIYSLFVIFR